MVSQDLPGDTEENNQKPQSEYSVSGPRFEPGSFRIRNKIDNQSTAKLGGTIHVRDVRSATDKMMDSLM